MSSRNVVHKYGDWWELYAWVPISWGHLTDFSIRLATEYAYSEWHVIIECSLFGFGLSLERR